MSVTQTYCLTCNKPLAGRSDQKYCDSYCRSSYHYQKNKAQQGSLYLEIDKQLKKNRRILKRFNMAGRATVNKKKLLEEGFNPQFFTHYWKTQKNEVYLFCYEYGFYAFTDQKGKMKYNLVTWQPFMSKSN